MRFRLARTKKYLCLICFVGVLVCICYLTSSVIYDYVLYVVIPKLFHMQQDNVTCYSESYNTVNDTNFVLNSIFFYQTSCQRTVPLRAACAIEAASMANRSRKVYLVFATAPDLTDDVMRQLARIKNLKIVSVDVVGKYSRIMQPSTPFFKTQKWEGRLYKITEDFLKLTTLYEHGGIVMDMDVIMAKPFKGLGNNWMLMDKNGFNLVAMRLSNNKFGNALANAILLNYRNSTRINYYSAVHAVYDAVEELCNISSTKYNITGASAGTCTDLKIYNRKILEPIRYEDRYLYFESGIWNLDDLDGYGYHTWDTYTRQYLREDSLYTMVARTYCPRLFSTFMYEFLETDDR